MNRLLYTLASLLALCSLSAQSLKKMSSERLAVSYDKTTHLIYPSAVKYVKSVDDFVVVDRPEEATHIVRIKANERGFKKNTTISVATADGRFYSYVVTYSDTPRTTHFIGKPAPAPEQVECSTSSDVHIVAPDKVAYIDFGNETITATLAEGTQNIVRIKAETAFDTPTNVSFALANGSFYSYDVVYTDALSTAVYTLDNGSDSEAVILDEPMLGGTEQEHILAKVKDRGRSFYSLGIKKYNLQMSIRNIFTFKEQTILDIELKNDSQVPYDVDYFKFSIKDKKTKKRTASQDVDLTGTIISPFSGRIASKSKERLIVVFPKFTLGEDKILELNLVEQGGGRSIAYNIGSASLNDATAL